MRKKSFLLASIAGMIGLTSKLYYIKTTTPTLLNKASRKVLQKGKRKKSLRERGNRLKRKRKKRC